MMARGVSSDSSGERTTPHSSVTSFSIEREGTDRPHSSLKGPSGGSGHEQHVIGASTESAETRHKRNHSSTMMAFHSSQGMAQSSSRSTIRNDSTSSKVSSLTKDSSIHSLDPLKIEIADLTHMFGRVKEQELLQAAFSRTIKRDTEKKDVVMIHGKAGTGKTALLVDFRDVISSNEAAYFCTGKFEQYQSLVRPYSGIIQAIDDLCEAISVGPDKDEARILLNEHLGYSTLKEISRIFPNLRDLIMGSSQKLFEERKIGNIGFDVASNSRKSMESGAWAYSTHELHNVLADFLRALCRGSRTIVLSLDDLQWADEASLECISTLVRDSSLLNLMLVVAFRDDEDNKCSFLLQHPEHNITDIPLDNLPQSSVEDILSDLTGTSSVKDLADIVLQKTHGNPFSIFQFLEMLQRKELLFFTFGTHKWIWDVEEIRSKTDVTPNVGNLLVEKIEKLPVDFRKLLTLAAVIGFTFEPKVVELIAFRLELLDSEYHEHLEGVIRDAVSGGLIHPDQTAAVMATQLQLADDGSTSSLKCLFYEESVQAAIQEAEDEGLIGKAVSRSKYKFAHDLVHKSFYDDSALDIERHRLHLHIGRILKSFYSVRPEDELLFAAVDHMNKGSHYIDMDDERINLIRLNQTASEKARARRAIYTAAKFSSNAIDLVKFDHDWMNHYDLILGAYNAAAELNFACGRFNLSLRRCMEIHRHARTSMDKLAASYIRVEILYSQRKARDAIDSCLSVLNSLGETLDKHPSKLYVLGEWRKTRKMIKVLSSDRLLCLPRMEDPVKRHTQRYLTRLISMAFNTIDDCLLEAAILLMLQNAIMHGMCDYTAFAIAGYGMLCAARSTMDEALDYGVKAIQLSEKMECQICIPSTYAIVFSTLRHWNNPLKESIEPLRRAYGIGVGAGEPQFAAACLAISAGAGFHCAVPLSVYTRDLKEFSDQAKSLRQENNWALIVPYWSAAMQLAGAGSRSNRKAARDLVDRLFPDSTKRDDGHGIVWRNHHMVTYIVAYIFQDLKAAVASRKKMDEPCKPPKSTHFMVSFELLFSGLLDYAIHRKTGSWIAFRRASKKTRQMKKLFKKGAINCEGMSVLLRAEKKARGRRIEPAKSLYDECIKSFSTSGFLHLQAIANERLAELLRTRKAPASLWQPYLRDAIKCYANWGASAKVNQVTEDYGMPARYSMGGTPCPILTIQDAPGYCGRSLILDRSKEAEIVTAEFSSDFLGDNV